MTLDFGPLPSCRGEAPSGSSYKTATITGGSQARGISSHLQSCLYRGWTSAVPVVSFRKEVNWLNTGDAREVSSIGIFQVVPLSNTTVYTVNFILKLAWECGWIEPVWQVGVRRLVYPLWFVLHPGVTLQLNSMVPTTVKWRQTPGWGVKCLSLLA